MVAATEPTEAASASVSVSVSAPHLATLFFLLSGVGSNAESESHADAYPTAYDRLPSVPAMAGKEKHNDILSSDPPPPAVDAFNPTKMPGRYSYRRVHPTLSETLSLVRMPPSPDA